MASETTPFVSKQIDPPSNAAGSETTAYFLDGAHKRIPSNFSVGEESFATAMSHEKNMSREQSAIKGEVVDNMPQGGISAEFNPRPVSGRNTAGGGAPSTTSTHQRLKMRKPSFGGGFLTHVADSWKPSTAPILREDPITNAGEIGTLVLPRKVPIKVEPKVHFANERTFLAWLHVVVILAAASMTILTYSTDENFVNQLYGIVLLPVSVAYIFYALYQCKLVEIILCGNNYLCFHFCLHAQSALIAHDASQSLSLLDIIFETTQ